MAPKTKPQPSGFNFIAAPLTAAELDAVIARTIAQCESAGIAPPTVEHARALLTECNRMVELGSLPRDNPQ